MTFKKGVSGNPRGKPKGTRAFATALGEKIMEDDAEEILRAVVEAAKAGDATAMKLCVERLVPLRRGRALEIALPKIELPADLTKALSAIVAAMAGGEITPDEAGTVAAVIETQRRALETVQLDERLRKLEAASK